MHVSFFSRSFLTIIESILGKIWIIRLHQCFYLFKNKINTYALLKICTQYEQMMSDLNIGNDLFDRVAYQT
jgi:hypothetical protein